MSVRRPMGMNSEVLNTNAENVSPMSASHWRGVMVPPCREGLPCSAAPCCAFSLIRVPSKACHLRFRLLANGSMRVEGASGGTL